jgi:hypothetical protein
MADYYSFEFLKDKTGQTPPSLQDQIIGSLLCEMAHLAYCQDGVKYVAKYDLESKRAVLIEPK